METDIKRETDVYNQIIANQQKVADIFISFFGEEYVDYQKPDESAIRAVIRRYPESTIEEIIKIIGEVGNLAGTILVYFPKVTVTNEHNASIEITQLFVRTRVTSMGTIWGAFDMTRGEYTLGQIRQGYIHSHCSGIPSEGNFSSCCLGSGPIRHTISLLIQDFDEDRWNLYCFELSEYVKVESLSGIPYNSLRNVVNSRYSPRVITPTYNLSQRVAIPERLKDFWLDYISTHELPLNFCNGNYSLAIPPITFFKDITYKYLEYLDPTGKTSIESIISRCPEDFRRGVYVNNTFHDYSNVVNSTISTGEGTFVCNFKGRRIRRHIIVDLPIQENPRDILLKPEYIDILLTRTLFLINYETTENSHQIDKEFRII